MVSNAFIFALWALYGCSSALPQASRQRETLYASPVPAQSSQPTLQPLIDTSYAGTQDALALQKTGKLFFSSSGNDGMLVSHKDCPVLADRTRRPVLWHGGAALDKLPLSFIDPGSCSRELPIGVVRWSYTIVGFPRPTVLQLCEDRMEPASRHRGHHIRQWLREYSIYHRDTSQC